MGAGNSKPEGQQSQHVFAADTPIRFSNELVEKLQSSPEVQHPLRFPDANAQISTKLPQSDTTRAKNLEAQIQARITAELEKIQSTESARFNKVSEEVSAEPSSSSEDSSPSIGEKIADAFSSQSTLDAKHKKQHLSHDSVSKEIAELKRKLEGRKKLEKADPSVEKAKEEVVRCLRVNDRRPLDCWQEVENFRREVGKMERNFVERTVR
ncbi:hypothetical protein W97_05443 [Coniosporium apollinis CBS 100218]|uniref:Altered inheritance of mitochondria protein 13, mitochondrial n=1 Tax=Coniosporium apollinis (strain CBS 100218) TaxID=1168221 RepID=R7YXE6_CONA1|nr:uncharacterized protein W97_05443 [Coniosporium apollinis CBS 100218]EON66346.1 hypothetical protein W97_05443 [Coniosporium apollinis CBS 100218]